jgi:putative ABC transport system permease protein
LRLALDNLHRPGAQTGALVTALGFGLSAFVLLAAVQTSLDANITARVPQRAPDYFVLDVPRDRMAEFDQTVRRIAPAAHVRMVPALRGAILAYGPPGTMTRVADLKEIPDDAWPLRGERGLTYSDGVPEGNTVTAGTWWPKGYQGEALVSIDEKLATVLHLGVGDQLTIGLLGVERTARIASLRRIDWDSLGFNYVLVFSPNAIADAPHNMAATINLPKGAPRGPLLRALVRAFPASSVIEVGGVLTQARDLLRQVSLAILAAASVAVLAGVAVLLGAIAAARASRTYDNVILRVLGASRRQLLLLQLAEYALLGALLALVALGLGSASATMVAARSCRAGSQPKGSSTRQPTAPASARRLGMWIRVNQPPAMNKGKTSAPAPATATASASAPACARGRVTTIVLPASGPVTLICSGRAFPGWRRPPACAGLRPTGDRAPRLRPDRHAVRRRPFPCRRRWRQSRATRAGRFR